MDYGIKVGDIFVSNTEIKIFFQVVSLKAKKQVILKEIKSEVDYNSSIDGGQTYNVKPLKDNFEKNSNYTPEDKTLIKTVFKRDYGYNKDKLYVSIKSPNSSYYRIDCFLWDEKEQLENDYYWLWWH